MPESSRHAPCAVLPESEGSFFRLEVLTAPSWRAGPVGRPTLRLGVPTTLTRGSRYGLRRDSDPRAVRRNRPHGADAPRELPRVLRASADGVGAQRQRLG